MVHNIKIFLNDFQYFVFNEQKFPKKVIVSLGKGSTFAPANDGEGEDRGEVCERSLKV